MRGLFNFIFVFLVVLLLYGFYHAAKSVNAQTKTASLVLEPKTVTKPVGQTFDATLTLTTPDFSYDISAFDITITYDKNILEVENIKPNTQYDSSLALSISNNIGSVRYARANSTKLDITGRIELGIITFRGKAKGQSQVKLQNVQITASRKAGILPINTTFANYTIAASVSPTPTPIEGDINTDGKVDILDYNIIVSCFSEKADTESCTQKDDADINSDGSVDGVDYNIFLRAIRS